MGRWSEQDSDEGRLPEGMQRVGYDADTQTYTYRDHDGSYWEGAPGARYGVLQRSGSSYQPKTITSVALAREEVPSSANGPHKQLFGLLSKGCGRLLVTLDLIYTRIAKKVTPASTSTSKKRQRERHGKRHPQPHTPRPRRRPHEWHEK